MSTDEFGREWRYDTTIDANGHVTITRGRAYQLPSDWTGDAWSHYWDGGGMCAFYDEGFRGLRIVDGADEGESEQALAAYRADREDVTGALDTLAQTMTGQEDARFIPVNIDRGVTLYALSYDGDPDGTWRDEIEAVACGDIWRIECEEYRDYGLPDTENNWLPSDEYPEEFYGEDKARAEFERIFPLPEFPADLS